MPNNFLEKQSVSLTLLSPIHIGCGEDYEPTNFVSDEEKLLLYYFDPSTVPLTDGERKHLGELAKGKSIREIYKFYDSHFQLYSSYAANFVHFDLRTQKRIEKLKNGNFGGGNSNRIEIPRTMYSVLNGKILPYIPGSTMKGAIHTAYLDRLAETYTGQLLSNRKLDEQLLKGKMDSSPMKLICLSDFMKRNTSYSGTRIISLNKVSKSDPPLFSSKGIPSAAEVMLPGEYRAFAGELLLKKPNGRDGVDASVAYKAISNIFKDLNRFNLAQFRKEIDYWSKGSHSTNRWLSSVNNLLHALEPRLEKGTAALVRIGKNTGAQNFTIRVPGVARISSKQKNGKYIDVGEPLSTTIALFDTTELRGAIPLGWAVLEMDSNVSEALKKWCTENSKLFPNNQKEVKEELNRLKSLVIKKQKEKAEEEAEQRRLEEERKKRDEEELRRLEEKKKKEEEEQRKLAEMPETLRRLFIIVTKIERVSKAPPGSPLYKEVFDLLAEAENWEESDQREVAAQIGRFFKTKGLDAGKDKNVMKARLRKLRGE